MQATIVLAQDGSPMGLERELPQRGDPKRHYCNLYFAKVDEPIFWVLEWAPDPGEDNDEDVTCISALKFEHFNDAIQAFVKIQ